MTTQAKNLIDRDTLSELRASMRGAAEVSTEALAAIATKVTAPVTQAFAPEWTCSGRHVSIFFAGLVTGIATVLVESHLLH